MPFWCDVYVVAPCFPYTAFTFRVHTFALEELPTSNSLVSVTVTSELVVEDGVCAPVSKGFGFVISFSSTELPLAGVRLLCFCVLELFHVRILGS
jgi:hypothetical protein